MKQPKKWKETVDPFSIEFNNFKLIKVLGYPHARNDVFHCIGKNTKEIVISLDFLGQNSYIIN